MVVAITNAPLKAAARFWWPLAFLALVPLSFALGSFWSFAPLAILPTALVLFDAWLGEDAGVGEAGGRAWRLLPWTYIPLQIAVLAWAAATVANPATSPAVAVGLTLSCGLAAGVFGFLAAHEMIHSPRPGERLLGLVMLAALLDMRFSISHLNGHHRNAATRADPASARLGETLYA
ncbi:MAG: hypothetical protein ACREEW_02415, partial [Caulobacteraceae bacterium]